MTPTVSRRTLARGAAWSVPAVVGASAVPALAATGACTPSVYLSGGFQYGYGYQSAATSSSAWAAKSSSRTCPPA